MKHIIILLMALVVSGCGSVDKRTPTYQHERPSPGEERYSDHWHCVAGQDRFWSCRARRQQIAPAAAVSESPPIPEPAPATDATSIEPAKDATPPPAVTVIEPPYAPGPEGFAVQLGAYSSREAAVAFLESLEGVQGEVVRTAGTRGELYVVLAGTYPDSESARAAAAELLNANPGLDYWLRQVAELQRATNALQ